jgi:hypothetical protein
MAERMTEWNDYDRDDRFAPDYYDPKKKDGAVDPGAGKTPKSLASVSR